MSSFKTYRRMMGFIKPYILIFIISALLSIFIVTLEGLSVWFLGTFPKILFLPDSAPVVKPVFSINTINETFKYWTYELILSSNKKDPLLFICLFIIGAFTLKNVVLYLNKILILFVNCKILKDIRNFVYKNLLLLPIKFYDKNDSGKIVSLMLNDVGQWNNAVTIALNSLILEPFRLIVLIGLLFIINAKLTLLIFVVYPILSLIIVKIGQSVRRKSERELQSYADFITILTEAITGIRIIKMFNTLKIEFDKFRKGSSNNISKYFLSQRLQSLLAPLNETISIYFTTALLFLAGKTAIIGDTNFSAEDFFRFLAILVVSYQPFKSLGGINSTIQMGIAGAERVFKRLALKQEMPSLKESNKTPPFENEITFDNVVFKYPGYDDTVIDAINFSAKKGEVVAIVGSSGAGKTTILDLLPRFYDVNEGSIKIDGKDIAGFDLLELRNLFGIVSQDNILFNDTITNNISYGTGIKNISFEKVKEAAEAANATSFIKSLPNGFDTIIGERGITLSGGQKQRIAIARALYKNPAILILDEATSALDTESEKSVQKAIDKLVKDRTTFVVAHRLSTILHADKIIVLEKGKIIEHGTHEELLKLGKKYKYFYDLQFF